MSTVTTMHPTPEQSANTNRSLLGFWIYLMTDCVLFASLFATYAVLRANTNGGPAGATLFDIHYVLLETVVLLTSSFSCGMALLGLQTRRRRLVVGALVATGLLGALFMGLELHEFSNLIADGSGPTRSGFTSAYFTLIGTHGLHICFGLLWLVVLLAQIMRKGLTGNISKRLTLFSLFWHFLDVIWIFIFSVVYLWGVTL